MVPVVSKILAFIPKIFRYIYDPHSFLSKKKKKKLTVETKYLLISINYSIGLSPSPISIKGLHLRVDISVTHLF